MVASQKHRLADERLRKNANICPFVIRQCDNHPSPAAPVQPAEIKRVNPGENEMKGAEQMDFSGHTP